MHPDASCSINRCCVALAVFLCSTYMKHITSSLPIACATCNGHYRLCMHTCLSNKPVRACNFVLQEPRPFDKFGTDYASETVDSMVAFDGSQQYRPFEVAWTSGELINHRGLRDVVPQGDSQIRVNHRVLDLVDRTQLKQARQTTMFRSLFPQYADGNDDDETQPATDDELCARGMIPQDIMFNFLLSICPYPLLHHICDPCIVCMHYATHAVHAPLCAGNACSILLYLGPFPKLT